MTQESINIYKNDVKNWQVDKQLPCSVQKIVPTAYQCLICSELMFCSQYELNYHLKLTHGLFNQDDIAVCTLCKELKNNALYLHMNGSHAVPMLECKICKNWRPTASMLTEHLTQKHHRNFLYSCELGSECCPYITSNKDCLNEHVKIIHERYECVSCKSLFFEIEQLIEHFQHCAHIKHYICSCGINLENKKDLVLHIKNREMCIDTLSLLYRTYI